MILGTRVNALKKVPGHPWVSALLSDVQCGILREEYLVHNRPRYNHFKDHSSNMRLEVARFLTDVSWTADLPPIQDVHFSTQESLPEMIPLDPHVEATLENWKEVCSMRHYFADIEKGKATAQGENASPKAEADHEIESPSIAVEDLDMRQDPPRMELCQSRHQYAWDSAFDWLKSTAIRNMT